MVGAGRWWEIRKGGGDVKKSKKRSQGRRGRGRRERRKKEKTGGKGNRASAFTVAKVGIGKLVYSE